jgi:hypothetical protein
VVSVMVIAQSSMTELQGLISVRLAASFETTSTLDSFDR